ncbi:glycerophosphodiester phosphodiesterase family protein [uncultured Algibacter sp.]|uniref:glycerophosphodiester phosphodiesterase family protein n=1 Tax=uncultured Algibacter sp. TaxID=298659 RepID=UPI0032173313
MKNVVFLLACFIIFSCKSRKTENVAVNDSNLLDLFSYKDNVKPIVSVHRGGKGIKNYPENCLETIMYINDSISAIYEIDIAKTKDGKLVLMHDDNLDRTSTGSGKLTSYTYKALKQFNLVDDYGHETTFKIPLFKDVLIWAKTNHVILTIDVKKSVNVKDIVAIIRETKAENVSIIITYNLKQARLAYKIAPELMLSVSARNEEELDWLVHSKIPTKNMIAFTGTRLSSKSFYQKVHQYGIKCMLGTLGNLDKKAKVKGDMLYKTWTDMGVDIIATDRPFEAAASLK